MKVIRKEVFKATKVEKASDHPAINVDQDGSLGIISSDGFAHVKVGDFILTDDKDVFVSVMSESDLKEQYHEVTEEETIAAEEDGE